jgi:hypothetical protein
MSNQEQMLDGNRSITAWDHRLFYGVTLFPFLLRVIEVACSFIFPEPQKPGTSFAVYSIFDVWNLMSLFYCFTIFLLLAATHYKITTSRLLISLFPLMWLVYFFDRWFMDTRWPIHLAAEVNPEYPFKPLDFILLPGSVIGVVTLPLVNILFIWAITMNIRLWREPKSVTDLS